MKKFLLLVSILLAFSAARADHIGDSTVSMGFMPYLGAQNLLRKYQPLAGYLSKEIGQKVEIVIAKNYRTHNENTGKNKLDISFLGGSPYVYVVKHYGLKPILARFEFNGKPYFRSVFYTAEGSKVKTLADLKGKKVAFGSRRSTLSTQVPYYMLMEDGLTGKKDFTYDFVDNQENVIYGVLTGDYAAGAASEEVFRDNKHLGLRAIAYSPYVSTHVFVASKNMPEHLRKKIQKALFDLKNKPEGPHVLHSISRSLTGFVKAEDSDYDVLRKILNKVMPELE